MDCGETKSTRGEKEKKNESTSEFHVMLGSLGEEAEERWRQCV